MKRYRICGMSVRSDLHYPGAVAIGRDDDDPDLTYPDWADPDVTVRAADVPFDLPSATVRTRNWQAGGSDFLLVVPRIGRIRVRAGREIAYQPLPEAPPGDMAPFVFGRALAVVLMQRGCLTLHGSAVQVGGTAVVFAGPSGRGKSTLAAALVAAGYPLVTDDLTAVALPVGAGPPQVLCDGRAPKLWADSIEALNLGGQAAEQVLSRVRKFHMAVPVGPACDALPIARICILEEGVPRRIEPVAGAAAVAAIRGIVYRPKLSRRLGLEPQMFRTAVLLAGACTVGRLIRPLGWEGLADDVAMLRAAWAADAATAGRMDEAAETGGSPATGRSALPPTG